MPTDDTAEPRREALRAAWTFAAAEAERALDAWLHAATHLKDVTYAAYREALDLEERAAADLAARVAPRVGRRLQARWAINRSLADHA